MGEKDWIRARSHKQIKLRITQILDSAALLFRDLDYDQVTMQRIARQSGFTRSNIYRYFTSRDEIFLTLFIDDIRLWAEDIDAGITDPMPREAFISQWLSILTRHQRLVELIPLLTTSLEKNASKEVYRTTKIAMNELIIKVSGIVNRALPSLDNDSLGIFIQVNQILIAGSWPVSRRSPDQDKVLDELEMPHMKLDFLDFMKRSLNAVLNGLGVD
ncbi:MAG: TetR family transcriptional regulator [Spirochaetaceae bacterium]|nr:TetR family transcriptional regulator [Spirochaetaceae bacterium]MDT8297463.1 TetR family transcriptional regulator [Spirochaetaceae bacterium]